MSTSYVFIFITTELILERPFLPAPFRCDVLWCGLWWCRLFLLQCQSCACTSFSACVLIERCLCSKRRLPPVARLWLCAQVDQDLFRFLVDLAHDLADPARVDAGQPFGGPLFFILGRQHLAQAL